MPLKWSSVWVDFLCKVSIMAKQDTSTKENQSFEGFPLPQYTQIPNLIIDFIMPDVSGNEFKVLLYIARRTLGFHKERDTVSLSQLVSGIKTRAGESLNRGTGLSKATVARCLNGLEQQGYIERVRRQDALRGFLPTEYRLKFKKMSAPQPLSQNETSPLVSERDKPLSQNETYKRNNKQKKQQHVVVALTNNGENPSISVNTKVDKIKTMLAQKKIRGELANKIANEYSEEYVQQKIDYLDFLLEYQPNQVERPAGWLRKAIEEDYGAPDGYKTKEEIEVVEKKKLAAEKAREARRASFEGERPIY